MISAVAYGADGVTEYDDIAAARDAAGTTWVRASDVSTADLRTVADAFDIHPLVVENVRDGVRPKTEEYAEHTFTLIKTDELVSGDRIFAEEVTDETVGICFGGDWVLTMTMVPGTPIERVWQAVLDGDERVLQRGPDFTAYRVMDVVVDGYFNLLDRLEDQIERIEEEVTVSTDIETLDAINALRRDLLAFRKLVWPCRGAVDILARGDPEYVQPASEKYFRNLYDHLVQIVDLIETYRDLTVGTRDIYLNTVSQSTNEVMKVLMLIATVFLPLTFVVGVYGMNFADGPYNMPELGWAYGYPAVMIGMALLGVGMLAYFRRRNYL